MIIVCSNFEQTKEVERAKKRLSSFTPPPAPTSGGVSAKGPAEWIPWPDLDGPKLQQQQKQQPATPSVEFGNLSQESIKKCKGLADMGFSLQRVVKVTSKEPLLYYFIFQICEHFYCRQS